MACRCLFTVVVCVAASILPVGAEAAGYTIIGWNNLGMHCMDADFSVFSILPPYNTIHAQVIDPAGHLVTDPAAAGIVVTYEAVADSTGSINRTSQGKTNFWENLAALFGTTLPTDVGLAGTRMPGVANTPQPMDWDAASQWFVAVGIPITPYDDAFQKNAYPMMRLVARTTSGSMLATTDIVLPVSDEMDCSTCHTPAAGTPAPAMPLAGWFHDPSDPQREMRLNILLKHDERQAADPAFASALSNVGYNPAGLYATVTTDHTPVLCALCHASEALGTGGQPGTSPLTQAMHHLHASVKDPLTGFDLDASDNRSACYRCHPGSLTRCLRGVMGAAVASDGSLAIQCQDCHGTMSAVGAADRIGWLNEPACQSCHTGTATHNNGQIRYTSVFDALGIVRAAVDDTFATTPDVPAQGLSLYRFSTGHGGLTCEACHGSTHAEYTSIHENDNVQSQERQGHKGMLVECSACHGTSFAVSAGGGPHGMHTVGQAWVSAHHDLVEQLGASSCQPCHGADYRGTVLSRAKANRTLSGEAGTKQVWAGMQIGCYMCHRGPSSGDPNPNHAPVVSNLSVSTPADTARSVSLNGRDADGDALTLRIVSQPGHGTTGLAGTTATYVPEPGFIGIDRFTYAAWDGQTDSNLGTVAVYVGIDAPAGMPISGKKLRIKDNPQDASKRQVVFRSRDAAISTATVNPAVDGAYVHVFNSAGGSDSACFYLPPGAAWRVLNGGTYRYMDSSLANSPVRVATFANGRLQLNAKGSGTHPITYRLGEPSQGSVGVVVTTGSSVLCANFGGSVGTDSGTNPPNPGGRGQFGAKIAPAPGSCPTPPDTCP